MGANVIIVDGSAGPLLERARELIVEYGRSIADLAALSLAYQGFEQEVAELPGRFAPPRGRLLVAIVDERAVGCVALRPLDALGPDVCEMKRMYVRPGVRGLGVGRLLAVRLLEEARAAGYSVMKLDSDVNPRFAPALGLYRSLGFADCADYNGDPDPHSVWMEKRL